MSYTSRPLGRFLPDGDSEVIQLGIVRISTGKCASSEGWHEQWVKVPWGKSSSLWIPQIPSVTNAIEISDMRKGTGGWVKKAPGSNNVTFDGKPLDGFFVMLNLICGQGKILALSLAKIIALTMLQQRG